MTRDDIDTGAVILTGLALLTENARAVAEALADTSGRFVAISAGDLLEARLAASGAGLNLHSERIDGTVIHIDIGGGTTKFTAWRRGSLLGVAAIDVGARLVTFDETRRIVRVERPAGSVAAALGCHLETGGLLDDATERDLARSLADEVLSHAGLRAAAPRWPALLRTEPLGQAGAAAAVVTGGVSEYVYARENRSFGDLGRALGRAIRMGLERAGIKLIACDTGIRATVLGVSQYSTQLSGNTVSVSDVRLLPQRNLPVLLLDLDLSAAELDAPSLAAAIRRRCAASGLPGRRFAVGLAWRGSATYVRLSALSEALMRGLDPILEPDQPLVVIVDRDIAGLLGAWLARQLGPARGVICIDSIELHEFDHIDIGLFAPRTRALPVVVKSLMFNNSREPAGVGRA